MKLMQEFKAFAMKGNVIDLAIGVVIGGAFGKIVTSLVNDLLMPILGLFLGKVNFSDMKYIIEPAAGDVPELAIRYGAFIQSVFDFVIIAFSIFIAIHLVTRFLAKQKAAEVAAPPPSPKQEILLEEIRDLLKWQQR